MIKVIAQYEKSAFLTGLVVMALLLTFIRPINAYGSLDKNTSWGNGWQYPPEQSLESADFALHVKRLCLNQVQEDDLDAEYVQQYLLECAADYGVFNLAAKR